MEGSEMRRIPVDFAFVKVVMNLLGMGGGNMIRCAPYFT